MLPIIKTKKFYYAVKDIYNVDYSIALTGC